MTSRVCIGRRFNGDTPGLYISKPGHNVLTTATENLIVNMSHDNLQMLLHTRVSKTMTGDGVVGTVLFGETLARRPFVHLFSLSEFQGIDITFDPSPNPLIDSQFDPEYRCTVGTSSFTLDSLGAGPRAAYCLVWNKAIN